MTRTYLACWTFAAVAACSGDGAGITATMSDGSSSTTAVGDTTDSTVTPTSDSPTTGAIVTTGGSMTATSDGSTGTAAASTGEPGTTATTTTDATTGTSGDTSEGSSTTGPSCGVCDEPNQECVDNQCITSCQGQDPDPCGPAQVCDVISGDCKDPADVCVLDGPSAACGPVTCGPGSVCDGVDTCLPIAPCAAVDCTQGGACWGIQCSCERVKDCVDPALAALNGPFSKEIGGLDFADDCTAWMVTLRSGTDYLRRLKPDGTLSEWAGVANLNMGEVKVLRSLTIPQLTIPFPLGDVGAVDPPAPAPIEGLGEVAITYTCCAACGCQADPPQGVARLIEEDLVKPLPIVIVAKVTQGMGPFGDKGADAGPQGLTWGVDRVLYVGNSTMNGDFNSADLEMGTQEIEFNFADRVTAAAPVSPVHLVVGLIGGEVHRFNVLTKQAELLVDLDANITGFSHDNFTGQVYAGLSTLEIAVFDPFTGEVATFDQMPGKGRVTFSPSGTLYFSPVKYLFNGTITSYDLPDAF